MSAFLGKEKVTENSSLGEQGSLFRDKEPDIFVGLSLEATVDCELSGNRMGCPIIGEWL